MTIMSTQVTKQELTRHEQALERCSPHLWKAAAQADSPQSWTRAYDQLALLENYLRDLAVIPVADSVMELKDIAGIRAANARTKAMHQSAA